VPGADVDVDDDVGAPIAVSLDAGGADPALDAGSPSQAVSISRRATAKGGRGFRRTLGCYRAASPTGADRELVTNVGRILRRLGRAPGGFGRGVPG
jgi:hypothetical protein